MGKINPRELRERTISILQEKGGRSDLEDITKKTPINLYKAFKIKDSFDIANLDSILKKDFKNPVISLYLKFSGDNTYRTDKIYLTQFNSLMKEEIKNKKQYLKNLNTEQKESVRKDLKDIEAFLIKLKDVTKEKFKSLIIFKSEKNLNIIITTLTDLYIKNKLVIDPNPYIVPIIETLKAHGTYLMLQVEPKQAIFYINQLNKIKKIKKVKIKGGFQKINIKAAGVPGKSQRDRRNQIHLFYKEIANNLDEFIYQKQYKGLFILGNKQNLKNIQNYLSYEANKILLSKIVTSPETTLKEIREKVDKHIQVKEKEEEKNALKALTRELNKGNAVQGIEAVIEAQNRFLCREIFLSENSIKPGYSCIQHNFLSLNKGKCPFCKNELTPISNLFEEIAEISRKYHIPTHIIKHFKKRARKFGGAAAILYPLDLE